MFQGALWTAPSEREMQRVPQWAGGMRCSLIYEKLQGGRLGSRSESLTRSWPCIPPLRLSGYEVLKSTLKSKSVRVKFLRKRHPKDLKAGRVVGLCWANQNLKDLKKMSQIWCVGALY